MAPDVVERRAKGLELYMTTLIRRFPDMLSSSHLDRCGSSGGKRWWWRGSQDADGFVFAPKKMN